MNPKSPPEAADGPGKPMTLGKAIGISFGIGLLLSGANIMYLARVRGLAATDEDAVMQSFLATALLFAAGLVPLLMGAGSLDRNVIIGGVAGVVMGAIYGWLTSAFWNGLLFGTCLGLGTSFALTRLGQEPNLLPFTATPSRTLAAVLGGFIIGHFSGWLPPAELIPKAEYLEKRRVSEDTNNPGSKLAALKVVASHLKGFPDRFAPDSKRTAFNDELKMRIDRFTGIAFDAKKNPSAAKAIVELFESKIEGKFSGHLYDILMEHVQGIYAESLDR